MSKITTERHYKITLSDGSTYYGRTTQPDDNRYDQHLKTAKRGANSNKYINEVYDKYGYDDWVHEWLSTETGDIKHHRKIEFGYVQADPKSINIHDGTSALLTKHQNNSRQHQQKYNNMTPEQHEEKKRKDRERAKLKRDNMTPEELNELRKKTNEAWWKWYNKQPKN